MEIYPAPTDWVQLQQLVARILTETGWVTQSPKTVALARGQAEIDVYAERNTSVPPSVLFCECKHWNSAVPQNVVHAFRSVVSDGGATTGYIIAKSGFQSGAKKARSYSNVQLLTWPEFQHLYAKEWLSKYFCEILYNEIGPLIEYTEPINSRVFHAADRLSDTKKEQFRRLREKYGPPAQLLMLLSQIHGENAIFSASLFKDNVEKSAYDLLAKFWKSYMPDALPGSFSDAMSPLIEFAKTTAQEFDKLFGGRV